MPKSLPASRCLLLVVSTVLSAAALASAPAAQASSSVYGDLHHFGSAGTGNGQFTEETETTNAFGVDPTDNSIYVGDKPQAKIFRIQKFSSSGTFLGSVSVKVGGSSELPESGIEGVAVDPPSPEKPEGRVYVLAVQSRGTEEQVGVDPETLAAGSLYSFKTEPSAEKKLVPAAETKEANGNQGVLDTPAMLHAQSKKLGEALLTPRGLTVDPSTHDVVILGSADRGTETEPLLSVALQRVSSKGALGARWVDLTDYFEEEEPSSPAVSSQGKVYIVGGVLGGEATAEIDRIPSSFNSSEPPTPLVRFDPNLEEIIEFPGALPVPQGAGLSFGPEGKLYVRASRAALHTPAVLAFSYEEKGEEAKATEVGWTGGQRWVEGAGHVQCAISFFGHPLIAAGKEGHLFSFDTNFEAPEVTEFGPGGTGCVEAAASPLEATVKGTKVIGTVPIGTAVTFSSKLLQGNALKVKWNFGDGTEETTAADSTAVTVTHPFTIEGKFKVTATIETDNLATPTLAPSSFELSTKASPPTAKFSVGPASPGLPVEFNGSSSTDPNGVAITEWLWKFGDGQQETRTTSTVKHTYAAAASYLVTLQVKDALGLISPPESKNVAVIAKEESKPPPPATTPAPAPPPTTTTPPGPPAQQVLTYSASLAGTSLSVSKSGAVTLKVKCLGAGSCSGSVTLRTLTAVSAGKHKKAILTLGTGSVTAASGHTASVTVHLSAIGRKLLAKVHSLRVRATILLRDSGGKLHTTALTVTLKLAKHR